MPLCGDELCRWIEEQLAIDKISFTGPSRINPHIDTKRTQYRDNRLQYWNYHASSTAAEWTRDEVNRPPRQ
jgi:hypothetical protein